MEATKPFEHSGKRPLREVRERIGHNKMNIEQAPKSATWTPTPSEVGEGSILPGRNPGPGKRTNLSDKGTGGVRRSSGDGMCAEETQRNTGSPPRWSDQAPTGTPRGAGRAVADDGEARSSEEAGNDRRAKEPQFQGSVSSSNGAEIGASLANSSHAPSAASSVACPSEGKVGLTANLPWAKA